jgi:3-deoxy-D-arabino-heptulosonate 7-phosphate (DAHP) synthase
MENNKAMGKWLHAFNLSHPLVIAGPCSAETEEQVMDIAHQLKGFRKKSHLELFLRFLQIYSRLVQIFS